jgi:hypothetical protein
LLSFFIILKEGKKLLSACRTRGGRRSRPRPKLPGSTGSYREHRALQAGQGAAVSAGACNFEVEVATKRVVARRRRLWPA